MNEPETAEVELRGHRLKVALRTQFDRQFWLRWVPNGWERETFDFLDQHVRPGSVFIDIGAWIGPISLYAAALGADVIALEPDPVSLPSLQDNVVMNQGLPGSIDARHTAFDARPGTIRIFGNHKGFGTSGSTAVRRGWRSISVPATTADDLLQEIGDRRPVVIKVDIEAHEYFCAEALARLRSATDATLNLSVHPKTFLKSLGWRNWMGQARGEMVRRTRDLIDAFSDADCVAMDPPHDLSGQNLDDRLLPAKGDPHEFVLVATPRS